ncbi:effector-associated constant component EACC1 [Streptomyces sp. NPDC002537]
MQATIIVESVNGPAGSDDLRRWLGGQPALRGRIRRQPDGPAPGTMGAASDVVLAALEPGGVAAAFAGAVVAWVRTRRGSQTVTVTRPDGTRFTLSTTQVKGLDARQAADLAQRLAATLEGGDGEAPPVAPPRP